MAVLDAQVEGARVYLTGHWRDGVAPAKGDYVLTGSGREERFRAAPVPPPSEAADARGQLVMRVLGRFRPTIEGPACLWSDEG